MFYLYNTLIQYISGVTLKAKKCQNLRTQLVVKQTVNYTIF
jgi:hypothetical protein